MAEVELMPVGLIDDALAQRPIEEDRLVRATGRRCGWCSDGRSRWPAEPDEELEDGRDEEPLLERRARDEERVSSVRYHAGGGFEARPHTYRCVHVRPQPGAPPHHRLLGVHWLWGLLHAEGRERRNVRCGVRCVQRPPGRREAADRHEHHRQAEKSAQDERASHRARASRHVRPAHGGRWVCLSLRRFGARDDGWMGGASCVTSVHAHDAQLERGELRLYKHGTASGAARRVCAFTRYPQRGTRVSLWLPLVVHHLHLPNSSKRRLPPQVRRISSPRRRHLHPLQHPAPWHAPTP